MTVEESTRGYYDPHPTLLISKPVCLAALPGVRHRHVARQVAAFYGLPFHDLDRVVEHGAGESIVRLVFELSRESLADLVAAAARRVLAERPAGVVALGDGSLLVPDVLRLVVEESCFVLLETEVADAYWRLRQRRDERSVPYLESPVGGIESLKGYERERREAYGRAHQVIDVRGLGVGKMAVLVGQLVERLGSPLRTRGPGE